jgi:maleate cis-trans isomerase
MTIYGQRARIGYTCPPLIAEVFAYEFYKMAPPGVSLMLTTLSLTVRSEQEVNQSFDLSLAAARKMAAAGASVVVLGGYPINIAHGGGDLASFQAEMSRDIGVPIVASAIAQGKALKALGSRKVGTVHPYEAAHDARHAEQIKGLGCEPHGVIACDMSLLDLGRVPMEMAPALARRLKRDNPEIDTIHFASAHWATAHCLEAVEAEHGVAVMSSQQAIFWDAIRTAGIKDPIPGYGRLLREF